MNFLNALIGDIELVTEIECKDKEEICIAFDVKVEKPRAENSREYEPIEFIDKEENSALPDDEVED